jgi:hypothetical protein
VWLVAKKHLLCSRIVPRNAVWCSIFHLDKKVKAMGKEQLGMQLKKPKTYQCRNILFYEDLI